MVTLLLFLRVVAGNNLAHGLSYHLTEVWLRVTICNAIHKDWQQLHLMLIFLFIILLLDDSAIFWVVDRRLVGTMLHLNAQVAHRAHQLFVLSARSHHENCFVGR